MSNTHIRFDYAGRCKKCERLYRWVTYVINGKKYRDTYTPRSYSIYKCGEGERVVVEDDLRLMEVTLRDLYGPDYLVFRTHDSVCTGKPPNKIKKEEVSHVKPDAQQNLFLK